jgi:hypothetical protein
MMLKRPHKIFWEADKMRKLMTAAILSLTILGTTSAANADVYYVEYYGHSLAGGLALHRFGCGTDGATNQDGYAFQGYSSVAYCTYGAPTSNNYNAYTYLGWNYANDGQLWSCNSATNYDYRYGGYNIICNKNSDCWIRDFSNRQGMAIGIESPCCCHWYCGCSGTSCDGA